MRPLLFLCLIGTVICKISDQYIHENNQFAIDLVKEISKNHRNNVIFSTLSIETLLGLTSLGAKGKTAEQIRKVLHLPQSEEKIKEQVKGLADEYDKAKHILTLANEIFLAKGIEVEPDFLRTATELFRAGIKNVEFGKTKEAVKEINSWVSENTNGKITDLINEDQISDITRMVLTNAIYFKGSFEHPFNPEDTKERDFYLTKNSSVKVETMKLTENIRTYTSTDHNVTYIILPYAGTDGRAYVSILIPHDVDGIDQVEESLEQTVPEKVNKYKKEYATVYLPKLKLKATLDLKAILKNMGITELFSAPDLSGITKESLTVDSITQKIVLNVDEKGTEAAVATAAIGNARSLPIGRPVPKVYRIDRPFYIAIMFDEIIILGGRVLNPLEENTN